MPSRRTFIQSGIAVSALAASPFTARAALAPQCKILFERELDESAAFRTEAERRGATTQATRSDIGNLWMFDMEPQLQQGPAAAVAGLMSAGPLFCLELLARDYGLRLVYRIEHTRAASGRIEHTLTGRPPSANWEQALTSAGRHWPAAAAALVTESGHLSPARITSPLPGTADAGGQPNYSIYTWMLAPDPHRRAILSPA